MVVLTDQNHFQVISNHINTFANEDDYMIHKIGVLTDTEIQQHLLYLKSFDMKIYFVYCSLLCTTKIMEVAGRYADMTDRYYLWITIHGSLIIFNIDLPVNLVMFKEEYQNGTRIANCKR